MEPWLTDWRGRFRPGGGAAPAPRDEEVAADVACAATRRRLVPQGGNTCMVGGATPRGAGPALVLSLAAA